MGHHAATCKGGVGAVHRHNRPPDNLYRELTSPAISLTVFRERVFVADLHKSPAEQRALDLFINDPLFAPTAQELNVTIVSPHSAPYRNQADGGLSALTRAERRKKKHYAIPSGAEAFLDATTAPSVLQAALLCLDAIVMPPTPPDDPDLPLPRYTVATNIPPPLPPSLKRRPSKFLQRPRKRSRPVPDAEEDPNNHLFSSLTSLSDTALACQTLHSAWPHQALLSLPRTPPLILLKQLHALVSDPTGIDDEVDNLARADYRKIRLPTSEEALVLLADFDRIPKSNAASRFVRELLPKVKSPVVPQGLIDAHFEHDVSAVLVREGLLTMRDEKSFWLAIPGMGEVLRSRCAGNREILALLRKAPYQEMLLEKLECRTLKKSMFTAQWHVRDVIGGEEAETVATSLGTLVRLRIGDA